MPVSHPSAAATADAGRISEPPPSIGQIPRLRPVSPIDDAPEQMALVPTPEKSEAKQRLLTLGHDQVSAYCKSSGLAVPTLKQFRNAIEVATYLNFQRFDDTGRPKAVTILEICNGAWRAYGLVPSKSVVERALTWLRAIGFVSSVQVGHATEHTIHFDHVEVVRTTGRRLLAGPSPVRHRSVISDENRRTDGVQMTDRRRADDGPDYILPVPFPSPTKSDRNDGPDWSTVVVDVRQSGVNQAKAAVEVARLQGATPNDVQAILTEWRTRRAGWQYAPQNLYRRLLQFDPQQSPADGWPPFDPEYQAALDAQAAATERVDRDRAVRRRQLAARRDRRRSRYQHAIDAIYAPTFFELLAAMSPKLAEGVADARRRRVISARQWERERASRVEIETADAAGRGQIIAARQQVHNAAVARVAAELAAQLPRPP
jgi:hypothetical protein